MCNAIAVANWQWHSGSTAICYVLYIHPPASNNYVTFVRSLLLYSFFQFYSPCQPTFFTAIIDDVITQLTG